MIRENAQELNMRSAREIVTGTGKDTFGVKTSLTRGQFLVMVMKVYGINPVEKTESNFLDAGRTYYTEYLATAKHM